MKHLSIALITLFYAHIASAEAVTYNCTMTKQDGHGWIALSYAFRVDNTAGTAMSASDYHDWTPTRFKSRGNKGYRMSWNVTEEASAGGNMRVRYQANLDPKNNSVKVRMSFVSTNAANKPYGVGTCETK